MSNPDAQTELLRFADATIDMLGRAMDPECCNSARSVAVNHVHLMARDIRYRWDKIEAERKATAQKALEEARESMRLVARNGVDLCVFPCKTMKEPMPGCSYLKDMPEVNGICTGCHLPRWHKEKK